MGPSKQDRHSLYRPTLHTDDGVDCEEGKIGDLEPLDEELGLLLVQVVLLGGRRSERDEAENHRNDNDGPHGWGEKETI